MNTVYISLCFLLSIFAGIYGSNIHLLPLQGNYSELFFYYTTIQVGTSPVSFTVIVDTGSSDLLLPSIDCTTCVGDITKFYCSSCSSTSSVVSCKDTSFICTDNCTNGGCHFVDTYDGGLAESAVATQDVVQLNDISTTVSFGDVYFIDMGNDTNNVQNMKNFQAVDDFYYPEGMWGLAYKSLSAFGAPTVIDSFVSANLMDDIFSLCLNDVGGMLVLGGIYPGYTDIIYTPIPYETFYTFQALDFTSNGISVSHDPSVFNSKVSIVDSGTPLPTVPTTVYSALKSLLLSNCSQNSLFGICSGVASDNETLFDGFCFDLDSDQISLFPTFEFVMQGETQGSNISLSLPPQVYLQSQYFCNETSQIGLGLAADPQFTIIGAQMMQTYLTVFDRQNKRIGFAPKTKC